MARGKADRLTTDEVRLIKGLLASGAVGKEVARVFDLSEQTISSIRTGKSHASFRPLQPNRVPSLKQVSERRVKARMDNAPANLSPKWRRLIEPDFAGAESPEGPTEPAVVVSEVRVPGDAGAESPGASTEPVEVGSESTDPAHAGPERPGETIGAVDVGEDTPEAAAERPGAPIGVINVGRDTPAVAVDGPTVEDVRREIATDPESEAQSALERAQARYRDAQSREDLDAAGREIARAAAALRAIREKESGP